MGFQKIKQHKVDARLSDSDYSSLVKIKEMGELDDNSAAMRFCIKFTTSLMKVIPATLVENLITTIDESDITTVPEGDAAEKDSQKI